MNHQQLCDQVTQSIIDAIESGEAGQWSAPWHHIGPAWAPRNASTGAYYQGTNIVTLAVAALDHQPPPCVDNKGNGTDEDREEGYGAEWATYKQWAALGAQVRRGERSTSVIKWVPKSRTSDNNDGDQTPPVGTPTSEEPKRRWLVPKVYPVFNAAQVDGWEPARSTEPADHEPVEVAEAWITGSGAEVAYGFNHARYSPTLDRIEVPGIDQYDNQLDHWSVLAHELAHWTSHPTRCDRRLGERFGDDAYAFEELIAELGSAFTMARLGLTNTPRSDHAIYLSSWLRVLKADSKALFAAASHAQRAVDYIANLVDPSD